MSSFPLSLSRSSAGGSDVAASAGGSRLLVAAPDQRTGAGGSVATLVDASLLQRMAHQLETIAAAQSRAQHAGAESEAAARAEQRAASAEAAQRALEEQVAALQLEVARRQTIASEASARATAAERRAQAAAEEKGALAGALDALQGELAAARNDAILAHADRLERSVALENARDAAQAAHEQLRQMREAHEQLAEREREQARALIAAECRASALAEQVARLESELLQERAARRETRVLEEALAALRSDMATRFSEATLQRGEISLRLTEALASVERESKRITLATQRPPAVPQSARISSRSESRLTKTTSAHDSRVAGTRSTRSIGDSVLSRSGSTPHTPAAEEKERERIKETEKEKRVSELERSMELEAAQNALLAQLVAAKNTAPDYKPVLDAVEMLRNALTTLATRVDGFEARVNGGLDALGGELSRLAPVTREELASELSIVQRTLQHASSSATEQARAEREARRVAWEARISALEKALARTGAQVGELASSASESAASVADGVRRQEEWSKRLTSLLDSLRSSVSEHAAADLVRSLAAHVAAMDKRQAATMEELKSMMREPDVLLQALDRHVTAGLAEVQRSLQALGESTTGSTERVQRSLQTILDSTRNAPPPAPVATPLPPPSPTATPLHPSLDSRLSAILDDLSRVVRLQSEHDELLTIFDGHFKALTDGQSEMQQSLASLLSQTALHEAVAQAIKHVQTRVDEMSEMQMAMQARAAEAHDELKSLVPLGVAPSSAADGDDLDDRTLDASAVVLENVWSLLRRMCLDGVVASTLPSGLPRQLQGGEAVDMLRVHPDDRAQLMRLIDMLPPNMQTHVHVLMRAFARINSDGTLRADPNRMLSDAVHDVQESIRRYLPPGSGSSPRGLGLLSSRGFLLGLLALVLTGLATGLAVGPSSCGAPSVEALNRAGLPANARGAWGLHS